MTYRKIASKHKSALSLISKTTSAASLQRLFEANRLQRCTEPNRCTMNPTRSQGSPPVRKRTKSSGHDTAPDTRQLYRGPGHFEVLGKPDGKDDDMLILVNRNSFLTGTGRGRGHVQSQVTGSNWNSFGQPLRTPGQGQRPSYKKEPPTTYQRSSYKPYPYDNVTMLSNPPRTRPLTISRLEDTPSHFLRSMERDTRTSQGWTTFPQSRSLHTSHSKGTEILFQSFRQPGPGTQQSLMTNVTPSELANRFSTTTISQRDNRNGPFDAEDPIDEGYETPQSFITDAKALRAHLRALRTWEYTTLGRLVGKGPEHSGGMAAGGTRFTILSYNILAQQHLENHQYLYRGCDPESLPWRGRFQLILNEISDFMPNIICFQEMEEAAFQSFTTALKGYRGVFKKRSGDKPDGCAIFFSSGMFSLVGKLALDLHQGHVPLLDRDNVALMLKLETKTARNRQRLVVATTHLLFNPKRHDVKLAQVQLVLAELDRFSFAGFGRQGEPLYLPLLLTGDFNTEPSSRIAALLTEGTFRYVDDEGHRPKFLKRNRVDTLEFLPPPFGINDQCQHYRLHLERVKQWKAVSRGPVDLDRKTQLALINVQSEPEPCPPNSAPSPSCAEEETARPRTVEPTNSSAFDPESHERCVSDLRKYGIPCSFGSGTLSHDLKLRNVYDHRLDHRDNAVAVATTKQFAWKCVDFIFQGMQWNAVEGKRVEGNLKLLRRLRLLSTNECKRIGPIPNLASPSDHYPLLAEFLLK